MRQKVFCIIGLLAILVFPLLSSAQTALPTPAPQPQTHCLDEDRHTGAESAMHLWTGPMNGYYYQVVKAIAAASKHMPDEIRIHFCSSHGSETNLAALLHNEADFAIVQSDVMHQLWHCEGQDAQPCEKQKSPRIRLVTPLFIEKAQVLVRPHLYVSSLSELKSSHCVWMGAKGSGSGPTAQMLLEAAGWTRRQRLRTDEILVRARAADA